LPVCQFARARDLRDIKDPRDIKDSRDIKDPRDIKDSRDIKDPKDIKPQDSGLKPQAYSLQSPASSLSP
jgi:CTD kinase subunit alpha